MSPNIEYDLTQLNLQPGNYSITVKAEVAGYPDSVASTAESYTVLPQLDAPTNVSISNTDVTFDEVANATSYEFFADGTSIGTYTVPTGYDISIDANAVITSEGSADPPVGITVDSVYYDLLTATKGTTLVTNAMGFSTNANKDFKYSMGGQIYTTLSSSTPVTLTDNAIILEASSWCLTGDTLITLADNSQKRIDELTCADKVLSLDPNTNKLFSNSIIYCDAAANKTHNEYDIYTFEDGSMLKTVHRHRLYNCESEGFVNMDEWLIGDHARTIDGRNIALVSHEHVDELTNHYTIFTAGCNNYFANNMLAGNKYSSEISFND